VLVKFLVEVLVLEFVELGPLCTSIVAGGISRPDPPRMSADGGEPRRTAAFVQSLVQVRRAEAPLEGGSSPPQNGRSDGSPRSESVSLPSYPRCL